MTCTPESGPVETGGYGLGLWCSTCISPVHVANAVTYNDTCTLHVRFKCTVVHIHVQYVISKHCSPIGHGCLDLLEDLDSPYFST